MFCGVGDLKLVTFVHVDDLTSMLVISLVDERNGQNRHGHLKVLTNTFRLQHPSPISMSP